MAVTWKIDLHPEFDEEFNELRKSVVSELFAKIRLLEEFGPQLGRPHADTLKGSKHAKMKELRFYANNGVWRVAFAFDPNRMAILLVAGDKTGVPEERFYRNLIRVADARYDNHLAKLKGS